MKRVVLYPYAKYFIPVLYGFGILSIVFGLLSIVKVVQSADYSFTSLLYRDLFQIPMGIMFIFFANQRKEDKKHHISWNDQQLFIHVIGEKEKQIPLEKIKKVNIETYRIELIYQDLGREDYQYYKAGFLLDTTYQELKVLEKKFE